VINELRKLKSIKVYDSEANYILVDLKENNSIELASKLLDEKHILIKDLSTKNFFHGKNFIRLAIRNEEDNNSLIEALFEFLK
jgi:histidinol-phosphate/aromatic aminotransferase/cobyric acid decarboxylase-like protein